MVRKGNPKGSLEFEFKLVGGSSILRPQYSAKSRHRRWPVVVFLSVPAVLAFWVQNEPEEAHIFRAAGRRLRGTPGCRGEMRLLVFGFAPRELEGLCMKLRKLSPGLSAVNPSLNLLAKLFLFSAIAALMCGCGFTRAQ